MTKPNIGQLIATLERQLKYYKTEAALRTATERDLAAAREAALRYGAHDADCLLNHHTATRCKCGWHQAHAALSPATKEPNDG